MSACCGPLLAGTKDMGDDLVPTPGAGAGKFLVVDLVEYEDVLAGRSQRFDLVWRVVKVRIC